MLHAFEQKLPFDDADIAIVERLKDVYGLDLTAADSHHLREEREKEVAFDEHRPCTRVSLTGRIEVNLPPDQAFLLFTPSGERTWAHGWDPSFPSPSPDETGLGSVFRTAHGDRERSDNARSELRARHGELRSLCKWDGDDCQL